MSWNLQLMGVGAHPLCAGLCRPQLLLDLLPNLLHRHLGLLDGSLGPCEACRRRRAQSHCPSLSFFFRHTRAHKHKPHVVTALQEATEVTGWIEIERQRHRYTSHSFPFSLDVWNDSLGDIKQVMTVHMWRSHCAVCLLSLLVSFSDLLGSVFVVPALNADFPKSVKVYDEFWHKTKKDTNKIEKTFPSC